MRIELDELLQITEPEDPGSCSLAELRSIRDRYQDVEHGLSYTRRIVQGRLDILGVELERRADPASRASHDLIDRLPEALAAHSRGPGLPRPVRELEPPAWAHELISGMDEILPPSRLGAISEMGEAELLDAAARIGELEREISAMRSEVHRRIDRIQDELVGRYRDGATVDDLLA